MSPPSEPAPDPAVADPRRDPADFIRAWCSLCGCTRPARIQPLVAVAASVAGPAETAPPPASALHEAPMDKPCVVKKEKEIEVAATEQDQEQEDASESPTPTDPKRRKDCPRGHAEVGFWWWCSMCQAAGYAGVAAKFMCAECTKMLPEGGTTPMMYCGSIKYESANLKLVHNKFEETVHQEFDELRSRLQKREEDRRGCTFHVAVNFIHQGLFIVKATGLFFRCLAHVEKYKFKFDSMLATGDPFSVVELCDSIPGILKQLECKPEHLSPCANSFLSCSTDDAEHMKSQIPQMCFISATGPILTCIKEELLPNSADTTGGNAAAHPGRFTKSAATDRGNQPRVGDSSSCKGPEITEVSKLHQQGGKLKIRGRGFGESRQAISVSVNNVVCGRILLSKPHTEITCSAPSVAQRHAHEGTLILTVAGQHVTSSISFGWEWDPDSCGDCLAIQPDDSTTVRKPPRSPLHNKQSTVTTTQIIGEGVYEWHLSISPNLTAVDNNNNGTMCHWVAYGLIPKPVFQDSETPLGSIMYGWTTGGDHMLGPSGTAFFADGSLPPPGQQSTAAAAAAAEATGGCEDVMLRYSPVAHTLTATWRCRNNIAMVIGNVPKGQD
ncbi:hypothetical protein Pelo_2615 [Pelomyxa schiedti]|nr:hypothetical protein Pelo_2615 [Pelomyxa schiedti]